jgi:hypothetical protein
VPTDYNEAGERYQYTAVGKGPGEATSRVLRPTALQFYEELEKAVRDRLRSNDAIALPAFACLQRFLSFLYYSRQFADNTSALYRLTPPPGSLLGAGLDEACMAFESLLFHGRAALDRLSFFVAAQVHRQSADKFSKLANVLANFSDKDPRASRARGCISDSLPYLEGLVLDTEDSSLRSALIHRRSIGEITTTAFTVHSLEDGRVLRFDHEIQRRPLVHSAQRLSQAVAYVVLNTLGAYINLGSGIAIDQCRPAWDNLTVCFTEYVDPDRAGPRFSVVKMLPDGFRIHTEHLRVEVLGFARKPVTEATEA